MRQSIIARGLLLAISLVFMALAPEVSFAHAGHSYSKSQFVSELASGQIKEAMTLDRLDNQRAIIVANSFVVSMSCCDGDCCFGGCCNSIAGGTHCPSCSGPGLFPAQDTTLSLPSLDSWRAKAFIGHLTVSVAPELPPPRV